MFSRDFGLSRKSTLANGCTCASFCSKCLEFISSLHAYADETTLVYVFKREFTGDLIWRKACHRFKESQKIGKIFV